MGGLGTCSKSSVFLDHTIGVWMLMFKESCLEKGSDKLPTPQKETKLENKYINKYTSIQEGFFLTAFWFFTSF